jgi:hypothetical protein
MKRKDFLKITALGVGAFGAGSLLTNAALSDSPQKVETPLETEGWLQEPPRQIPVVASADVVVAGGGPAGIAAAIAAAWFSGHSHARRQAETDKELTIRVDEVEDTVPTPTDPEINLQILYSEINDIGELATVEYLFTDAAKYSESMQYDGWDIPFTEKSFVLKWNGVIKAGVDLKRIRITVDEQNKNITVSMPAAKILSYEVDNDSIEVLDERDNIFNSISVDDKTRFDATTEDAMKQGRRRAKARARVGKKMAPRQQKPEI